MRNDTSKSVERIIEGLPISPGTCFEFSLHCISRVTKVFKRPSTVATDNIKSKLLPIFKYRAIIKYVFVVIIVTI